MCKFGVKRKKFAKKNLGYVYIQRFFVEVSSRSFSVPLQSRVQNFVKHLRWVFIKPITNSTKGSILDIPLHYIRTFETFSQSQYSDVNKNSQ